MPVGAVRFFDNFVENGLKGTRGAFLVEDEGL
jgi:hypothetical protein